MYRIILGNGKILHNLKNFEKNWFSYKDYVLKKCKLNKNKFKNVFFKKKEEKENIIVVYKCQHTYICWKSIIKK